MFSCPQIGVGPIQDLLDLKTLSPASNFGKFEELVKEKNRAEFIPC